jgi:hypothetical protein
MKPSIALLPPNAPVPRADEAPAAAAPAARGLSQALVVAAVLLVGAVTLFQGLWTDRWVQQADPRLIQKAARALEEGFPETFGDWEWIKEIDPKSDPKELARAGAVGHVARAFRNNRTKAVISTFVVCATPYHASAHTPDRCYPGAGFEIAESEHRLTVPLSDGREAETFTGTFRKDNQTLRVFWTYGLQHRWVAPQLARIELQNAGVDSVYKLYAIIDETKLRNSQSLEECKDFLATLLPVLDASVAKALEQPAASAAEETPAPAAAAEATDTAASR